MNSPSQRPLLLVSWHGAQPALPCLELDAPARFDWLLFVFVRRPHAPIGTLQLEGAEALTVWSMRQLPAARVVAVSCGE